MPPAFRRLVEHPGRDPLSGILGFLVAVYAGEIAAARRQLDDLFARDGGWAARALFLEGDLRKLVARCFAGATASRRPSAEQAALLLDFARVCDPSFAGIERPEPPGKAELLAFDYEHSLSRRLRIRLLFRDRYGLAGSRPHDFGERLRSAFAAAGAECTLHPSETDPATLGPADLVLFDDDGAFRKDPARKQAHREKLRKAAKRLGCLALDPWGKGFGTRLAEVAGLVDFVWTMAPRLPEASGLPAEKFCLIPFPCGFGEIFDRVAQVPPSVDLGFCGTVEDYNIHRYFWLLLEIAGGSSLHVDPTSHAEDGNSVESSIESYLWRLLSSRACLSLTMRATGDRIVVGRTFDVLRGGRLLVQERTADAGYYLTPGEHFIEVEHPEDLAGVVDRLSGGDRGEAVRAAGAQRFKRFFSDQAVVRHLAALC